MKPYIPPSFPKSASTKIWCNWCQEYGDHQSGTVRSRALEWHRMSDADMRLRMGELTAQEIRSIRAVLNHIVGQP